MENIVNAEVSKKVNELIEGGFQAKKRFFNTGIAIQKGAYNEDYARRKADFTCGCLIMSGFCNRDCDGCKLEIEARKAIKEIRAGLRTKPERKSANRQRTYTIKVNGRVKEIRTIFY